MIYLIYSVMFGYIGYMVLGAITKNNPIKAESINQGGVLSPTIKHHRTVDRIL